MSDSLEHCTHQELIDQVRNLRAEVERLHRPWDPVRDIAEFHKKFQVDYEGPPRLLQGELAEFRQKFLREELEEYEVAHRMAYDVTTQSLQYRDRAEFTHWLEQQFDALVDLVYVALGTSHLHGFDFRKGWDRVHAANMSKVRALNADQSKRGSSFDVVKPDGWEPPQLTDLVEGHNLDEIHNP